MHFRLKHCSALLTEWTMFLYVPIQHMDSMFCIHDSIRIQLDLGAHNKCIDVTCLYFTDKPKFKARGDCGILLEKNEQKHSLYNKDKNYFKRHMYIVMQTLIRAKPYF